MTRITIEYSENPRESKKIGEVYGILEDGGFKPESFFSRHWVDRGIFQCVYVFHEETDLPTQKELEEMLKGMSLTGIIRETF